MNNDSKIEACHSTTPAYKVEVRVPPGALTLPFVTANMIVDSQWRELVMNHGPVGVPPGLWSPELVKRGYASYNSAMAIGHWFLAEVPQHAVEFRVVEYIAQVDISIRRNTEGEPVQKNIFTMKASKETP